MRRPLTTLVRSAIVIGLFATIAELSQLHLAPVYGALTASTHREALFGNWSQLPLLAFWLFLCRNRPPRPSRAAVLVCLRIPLQDVLLRLGVRRMSDIFAPAVIEICTVFPVMVDLALLVYNDLMSLQWHEALKIPRRWWILVVGILMGFCYMWIENYAKSYVPMICNTPASGGIGVSRAGLQLQIAAIMMLFISPRQPRKFIIALMLSLAGIGIITAGTTVPFRLLNAITGTTTYNAVNHELGKHGWKVLARAESTTGYISVLEDTNAQMRLMRCDHSILGGEWLLTDERKAKEGWTVPEPIFGVFEMLEAVRLVERNSVADSVELKQEKRALVIGLGVGTAPKALIAHGVNTTVLELDPLVHRYAIDYFGLPNNHTAILTDAISWVRDVAYDQIELYKPWLGRSSPLTQQYDYIIYDVFTGGASPLALFTLESLAALKVLLNEHGVVAINYAGDITSEPMRNVLRTIDHVFIERCRAFREMPATTSAANEGDMLNAVVFCAKSDKMWPFSFRDPGEADYLGSKSRARFLAPKKELEFVLPASGDEHIELVWDSNKDKWKGEQRRAGRRHWKLMRDMIPAVVWENW